MSLPSQPPASNDFPKDWPSDSPPGDAVDADGTVFRIVKDDPPVAKDFESHFESGKLLKAPPCLRCGLSVFRQFQDADHQRKLMPKLGSLVASAKLRSMHGKTKLTKGTQPTHTTWWVFDRVNRASLFSVNKEES